MREKRLIDYQHIISRVAAEECSPQCKLWVKNSASIASPEGAKETTPACHPFVSKPSSDVIPNRLEEPVRNLLFAYVVTTLARSKSGRTHEPKQ
jgi:hypothetical protein